MSKVALIYPPIAQPFVPSLAVAELQAVLEDFGHTVIPYDLNIQVYEDLFNHRYLNELLQFYQQKLNNYRFCANLSALDVIDYDITIRAIVLLPYLIERIEPSIKRIKSLKNYDIDGNGIEKLNESWFVLRKSYELIFKLRDGSIYDNASCFLNATSILDVIRNPEITPFANVFQSYVTMIKNESPDFIGINITFPEQLLPAFQLSNMLRNSIPCKIIFGGSIPKLLSSNLENYSELFNYVDAICVGDGEPTLICMADRQEFKDIPNILYQVSDGTIVKTKKAFWNIKKSPTPVFSTKNLVKLFTPEVVLPYQTTRSCFYGKCAFCNYTIINPKFQSRSNIQIVNDLTSIKETYGVKLFSFADDATSSSRLHEISQAILERNLTNILWWTCSRFDGRWTYDMLIKMEEAGCARLFFGLESADELVQARLAQKGFKIEKVIRVLQTIKETRIHPHLSAIIGFPTEGYLEAKKTVDFILNESTHPKTTSRIHVFRLVKDSQFALSINKMSDQWITKIDRSSIDSLAIEFPRYQTSNRMSPEEIDDLLSFYNENKNKGGFRSYPEFHTYEPLIWAYVHNRKIPLKPHIKEETGKFLYPYMNHKVAYFIVPFSPAQARNKTKLAYENAENLVYTNKTVEWKQALVTATTKLGTISNVEQLLIYNIDSDGFITTIPQILDVLVMFNGRNRVTTIKTKWLSLGIGEIKVFDELFKKLVELKIVLLD